MEKNPSIILFVNQTITDLDRFCTMRVSFNYFLSVPRDTIDQITEHYLTQAAFENLSVLSRNTLKRPWFPGVCIFQREAFEDFAYF